MPAENALAETAYAKINLALHVRRRREDGYHELETAFAFVDAGDLLTVEAAQRDELRTVGEFSSQLNDPFNNIVAQALSLLPHGPGLKVTLDKRLPVAAGLGGGSADAGAVFRLIERRHGLPADWAERAAKLGADVPACVRSEACLGHGTGTELSPLENDLAGTPVLLVNPRIPLTTGPVFEAWDGMDRGPLPQGAASAIAYAGRNDLEQPALSLCPIISDVLALLDRTGAKVSRMSGSGATCFAFYKDDHDLRIADDMVREEWGGWWTLAGHLR
ncbi:MAG: 4-(cytidine 5'-diphospho)-2-C-methyl-D-erythritol kinase [Novosphingobium sp.]